jgi:two-component system response regulator WspF
VLGVLLTGMGRDGALGLLELRKRGVFTMAQNKETCAVFGMPKAAIDIDAAVRVCSLVEIARELQVWQPSNAHGELV